MPYILNKTNGTILSTVQDASLDQTTDLLFVGKNYAGYGEIQNENFLKLLENFANTSAPSKPIEGQLWYNTTEKRLYAYDSQYWKGVANLEIATESNIPSSTKNPREGDLWYNKSKKQINVFDGSDYITVGPPIGSDTRAQWRGDFEYNANSLDLPIYNIKAVIGSANEVIAIVSQETYSVPASESVSDPGEYPIYPTTTRLVRGITLVGADAVTGSTRKEVTGLATDSYFWGTAAEALHSLTASTATYASSMAYQEILSSQGSANKPYFVPFLSTSTSSAVVYANTGLQYNPVTRVLSTIASSSLYADLAERYAADNFYTYGTVVVIGGEKEITVTNKRADTSVAGIISKHPAFRMNEDVGENNTHPFVALKGRVLCKVNGPVKKGQLLVTSSKPGYAEAAADNDHPCAVLGKALEDSKDDDDRIEVMV
ncbi:MAG: hypothetical protein EBU90_04620 [Proteobacteria bacterium]|nr:hypothetical protein [Pseudomonadota bacterium]NBP13725.1 hypothetical protein [bacterium]